MAAHAYQKCLIIFSVIIVLVTKAHPTFGISADVHGGNQIVYVNGQPITIDYDILRQISVTLRSGKNTLVINNVPYVVVFASGPGPNTIVMDGNYISMISSALPGTQVTSQQLQVLYINGQPTTVDEHMINQISNVMQNGGNKIIIKNVPFIVREAPGPGPNTIVINNRYYQIFPANQG